MGELKLKYFFYKLIVGHLFKIHTVTLIITFHILQPSLNVLQK